MEGSRIDGALELRPRAGRYRAGVTATGDAEGVFTDIYRQDHWHGGSGEGSTAEATAPYRHIVERLVVSPEIRSIVDLGCGDWQLGSLVDWHGRRYTGVDVVEDVVAADRDRWGDERTRFTAGDAMTGDVPSGDLLLVKDVLQHWPTSDVERFLRQVLPRYSYALLTNDLASVHWDGPVNADMTLGGWRTLDLEIAPFEIEARHRWDFDIRGEWTKRVLLVTHGSRWQTGRFVPRSVRRIAASITIPAG